MNSNTMSQSKVNFQTNDDSSFKIQFTDNDRYLNDGTVILPKNSLGYVVDESELITLIKPCGDPYISFKIADTQFADLAAFETWFADNAVGTGGGSVDPEQLAGLIADAEYVSSATTIVFYNLDGDEVCSIDATAFIKDGMVDNVAISGSNLVITWNTSAGKQPISIPLSSIFNPENYYDKTAIDGMLQQAYRDTSDALYLLSAATDTKLANKADTSALTQHISDSNAHFTGSQKSNYDAFEGQFYSDDAWDVTPLVVFNDFYQSDYPAAMGQFDQRITSNTNAIATKADTSAVTVDEYSIYATRDNNISTAYTSVPITWLKFYPKSNAATTGNFQFSGITGYLTLNSIDYANGTYAVAPNSQVQPSAVNGLSISFEDGNMIVEVDGSNPITYASITNTVIEYVKTVIPEKAVSDAVYDNLYPLIKKVDNSLTSITINSASTVQNSISLRPRNNANDILSNQIVNLDGYLTYSGTTLKAEAYVETGTETLTTIANSYTSSSARSDYYFTDNVGQRANASHMEIQILRGDKVYLDFFGDSINGWQRSEQLTVENGTVTSGNTWPAEATYSLSDGVLTVDYAFTGTTQNTPVSINYIMATTDWGSTASVSDIVGYVKALLKDKVEVTEYIENTLAEELSGKASTSAVTAAVSAVTPCVFDFGKASTVGITDDDWNNVMDAYVNHKPIIGILGSLFYTCESLVLTTDADNHQVFTFTVSDGTSRYILDVTNFGNSQYQITRYDTIALPTTSNMTAWSAKQDALIAGSGITISGNVISAEGGSGGMSEDDELLLATALTDLHTNKANKNDLNRYQLKGDYITSAVLDTKLAEYETALDEQNIEEVTSNALNDLNARLTTVETALGGLSLSAITQSQWATISGSANPSTIYIITNNE